MYFSYSKDLLNENPEFTKKNFQNLISTISSDIEKIPDKDTKNFYIYAQSLGGLFGMIISDLVKINKVSLICPGYHLATCFWEVVATNEIRERMVKNNINLNILKEVWREISPDNYFKSKSREAEFNILLSRNDQIIPYGNGKQLVNFLELNNYRIKFNEVSTSHELTLIKEIRNFRRTIKYYKSPLK